MSVASGRNHKKKFETIWLEVLPMGTEMVCEETVISEFRFEDELWVYLTPCQLLQLYEFLKSLIL